MDLVSTTALSAATIAITAPSAARLFAAAGNGDGEACHDLGVAYSTGRQETRDLIEAHKWFNLGATYGCDEAAWSRADIALEMSRSQIAEAQRRAREWIGGVMRQAA